ncbi:MAG: MCE family protein [Actinomycetota bacterium]|nr:MCE family protein [Actinomycetota bacterium]
MKARLGIVLASLVLTGCGVGADDLPLPGTSVSGASYRISAVFDDALNLPIGAQVKLHGVPVGKVRTVESRDFKARIGLELRSANRLHKGATARLRSTTPLGELYVEIDDPKSGEALADGDVLGTEATSTAPSIEDSMAAASLLLNGGNLGQLRSIVRETNKAFDGRELDARDLLTRLTTTTAAFESSSGDIERALAALASVSTQMNKRESTINAALRDVAPAAKVLRDNTEELSDLLVGIKGLGSVSQRVVDRTHEQILEILRQTGPILDELLVVKDEFGPGLSDLVRFAELLDRGVPTDYLNTYLYFDDSIGLGVPAEVPGLGGLPTLDTPGLPDLGLPDLGLLPSQGTTPKQPDIGLGGLLGGPAGWTP